MKEFWADYWIAFKWTLAICIIVAIVAGLSFFTYQALTCLFGSYVTSLIFVGISVVFSIPLFVAGMKFASKIPKC
jgi:hypothetical protein